MQSKVLLKKLKQMERKANGKRRQYVFFGKPSRAELAKLPEGARVIIFVGEDDIPD